MKWLSSFGLSAIILSGIILSASSSVSQTICETLSYYNAGGTTAVFKQKLPTAKWAVKMTPQAIARVDTAYIGFGLRKGSGAGQQDTIEITILDNNPPTFTQLDRDQLVIIPPFPLNYIPDDFYLMELDFQSPAAMIDPARDFWIAYKFKGPSNDTARILFKTPAANEARSVVINANGSTTLASTYVAQQIPTTVDLYAETHVCYPFGIPVELQSFTAWYEEGKSVLEWTTASETDNFGFEIERVIATSESGRAKVWQRIGFVPGRGTSTEKNVYSFIDPDPTSVKDLDGYVTYRLRQIDLDGKLHLSPIAKVFVGNPANTFALEQNYPNPFSAGSYGNPTTTIRYNLPEPSHVTLMISDRNGSTVDIIVDEDQSAGSHSIFYDASHLSSGLYQYTLRNGRKQLTKQMVLVK